MPELTEINWDTTAEVDLLIFKVVKRAAEFPEYFDKLKLSMDLAATHLNGCPLDFEKLLEFEEGNFLHDISGISCHINRNIGKLENCFLPRCNL